MLLTVVMEELMDKMIWDAPFSYLLTKIPAQGSWLIPAPLYIQASRVSLVNGKVRSSASPYL